MSKYSKFTIEYSKGAYDGDIAPIKSVRRLSDEEVFSIGDEVKPPLYKITKFVLSNGKIMVYNQYNNWYFLDQIEKVKEPIPLFKTVDGKEIFEGDETIWVVDKCDYELWSTNAISLANTGENKYFSTKDKAKEYIYHNKPILSYNDAVHWLASDGSGYGLYELVKEKINNYVIL